MSPRDWVFRIQDILSAVEKIETYTRGMSFEEFVEDRKTVDAVIRNLTIIGEAAIHIPEEVILKYPHVHWKEMKGMRNIVVHEYFGVSDRIIWTTIQKDLPLVNQQLLDLQEKIEE
ncbi:MAG: hypothetical protein PWR02_988 [Synergistales bacterium]|nr:hypothetical protein [Synergistaceae bacterium]MDN5335962.1 hypothetical protein [Synergistales bacterium]